jgi:hypothetical protein
MPKALPDKVAGAIGLLTNICIRDRIYGLRFRDDWGGWNGWLRTFFTKDVLARELYNVRYPRAPAILQDLYSERCDELKEVFVKQALLKRGCPYSLEDVQHQIDTYLHSRVKRFVYELILVNAAKDATRAIVPPEMEQRLILWLW